ncbi:MAG TPA: HNH endonuclease [Polyangiaceae bacterium]|nr:HNH endonuclease [Polyangiaceae bacterium]
MRARSQTGGFGLDSPVLVLNQGYRPVRITEARNGLAMLYLGRARALDATFEPFTFEAWCKRPPSPTDEAIGTPRGPICVPRVLLLEHYSRVPRAPLRLSRRHVYLRDNYTCQYCGRMPGLKELNLDHVHPRSRGGRSTWENLVTSCRPCNLGKGGATPEEANMRLRKPPVRPGWSLALTLAASRRRFVEWEPFIGAVGATLRAGGGESGLVPPRGE